MIIYQTGEDMNEKVDILGVNVDKITLDEALEQAQEMFQDGKKHSVFTPNPEIVELAQKDSELMAILNEADLLLPDGIGIVLASRVVKEPIKERVPGIDFVSGLFDVAVNMGKKVFLFGAAPGVAELAKIKLGEKHPGIEVSGLRNGFFKEDENCSIIDVINNSGADFLLVCLGAPKQEKWIAKYREQLNPAICVGAGGALDVFSGKVNRAPRVMQKMGLEWLYRVAKSPSRIPRLAAIPKFLWKVTFRPKRKDEN